jgi:hypothetical protein
MRADKSSALVTRSIWETIVRTVLSKVNGRPSRYDPRWMLSFFEGIQARWPSGEMVIEVR